MKHCLHCRREPQFGVRGLCMDCAYHEDICAAYPMKPTKEIAQKIHDELAEAGDRVCQYLSIRVLDLLEAAIEVFPSENSNP